MGNFEEYIKGLSNNCLEYLLNIYRFEANCEVEEYSKKAKLIEEELKLR